MDRREFLKLISDDYKDEANIIDIDENSEISTNQNNYTKETSLVNPDNQADSLEELLKKFYEGQDEETLEQMKRLIQLFKQIQGPLRFIQQIQGPLRLVQQIQGPLQLVRQLQGPLQMQYPMNVINQMGANQLQYHTQRQLQERFKKQLEEVLYQQMYVMIQRQISQQIMQQLGKEIQKQLPHILNSFLNKGTK